MANVILTGYPAVYSCRIFQKSTADAGSIVIRTAYGSGDIPPETFLQCFANGFAGTWAVRLKKSPRVIKDYVLWVFEDDRALLRDVLLSNDYNTRNANGVIDSETEKTIPELWGILSLESGLPIVVESSPAFKPTMNWDGLNGRDAANMLLLYTGSRMVYDAVDGAYHIRVAGDGPALDYSNRVFAPGPDVTIKNLHVDSSPVLYEGYVTAEAVVENASGDLVKIDTIVDPIDLFTMFSGVAAIRDRWRYQQSAMRLWRAISVTHPKATDAVDLELYDKRAVTIASGDGSVAVDAHAYVGGLVCFPHYHVRQAAESYGEVSLSKVPGRDLFASSSPIISVDAGGDIQVDMKIVTSYRVKEGGEFKSNRETVAINASGADKAVSVPWIKPIESEIPDAPAAATAWDAVHRDVADAMAEVYRGAPQTVTLAAAIRTYGNGTVGGAYYEFISGRRANVTTILALNFVPDGQGDLS